MSKKPTFRFMVESEGQQSLVWSVSINKNDVYISSSVSKQTKVSLHESGRYQWSLRSESLANASYIPETGRHFAKWEAPKLPAGDFTQEFFILIPQSELSSEHAQPTKEVMRLSAPPLGSAVQISFFLLAKGQAGAVSRIEPKPLFWHQLRDKRVLVLVHHLSPLNQNTLNQLSRVRMAMLREAQAHRQRLRGQARITSSHGVSGLIEVGPIKPSMKLDQSAPSFLT